MRFLWHVCIGFLYMLIIIPAVFVALVVYHSVKEHLRGKP